MQRRVDCYFFEQLLGQPEGGQLTHSPRMPPPSEGGLPREGDDASGLSLATGAALVVAVAVGVMEIGGAVSLGVLTVGCADGQPRVDAMNRYANARILVLTTQHLGRGRAVTARVRRRAVHQTSSDRSSQAQFPSPR